MLHEYMDEDSDDMEDNDEKINAATGSSEL